MAFGVFETSGNEFVPGTSRLEEDATSRSTQLKKAGGNDSDTVLVPQPSNNPNDPLNWPLWQRDLILLLLCYCTNICVGGVGPLVSTIALPIIQEFHVTFQDVSLLSGYQVLVVGAVAPIVSALARKYGKRPVYLVSSAFLLAGSILCTFASSYDVLLTGRLLQGVGTAAFESIPFSAVGDLYFVHQRGLRMALYVSSAVGLVLLPGMIAGVIATSMDWRWCFGILSIFMAIGTLGIVLFGWETSYVRNEPCIDEPNSLVTDSQEKAEVRQLENIPSSSDVDGRRDSFLQRMKPFSGIYDDKSLLKMTLQPFYLIANPIVIWAVLINGFGQLWNVVISLVLAQIFSPPPYLMDSAQLGYLNTGPIVAGLISCLVCGVVSDHMALFISRRNNGIYEPEFRLLLVIVAPIFSTVGFFLFGYLAEQGKSPILISFVWGLAFVSTQVVGTATSSYLVDAYREVDVHIFVLSMSIKNFFFFGFSYFMNDWVAEWGPARVFQCIGGTMLALSATTIPAYIYGKRVRLWWHNHDLFRASKAHDS
ncbi:major facilitator superfamily domain-containing protein [Ilyonectria sp. MPI-CAGE-AT-0026]|nr:major facilitator superfamily domain-containing protein [Ilyonectria sp. MPI-CAGE-AT-0026]